MKQSNRKKNTQNSEVKVDAMGFTKSKLNEYDKSVGFYYTNLINSLILYTYNEKQLDKMAPILIDPLTELYEELDYAFTPVLFETVFRNKLIDNQFKNELHKFKTMVNEIPNEIWDWKYLDKHETWVKIRSEADKLLNNIGIETRDYNNDYTKVVSNTGEVLFKGNKMD